MSYLVLNNETDGETPVACDNCGWVGKAADVEPVINLETRIEPGGEVPVGECPSCGSLAYIDKRVNPFAKLTPELRAQYAGQCIAVELATGEVLHAADTAAVLEAYMQHTYPTTEYGLLCLPACEFNLGGEQPGPWSVLYTARPGCDTDLVRIGPYKTQEEAADAAQAAQDRRDFDVRDQRIYLIGPDHQLHEIETCELVREEPT